MDNKFYRRRQQSLAAVGLGLGSAPYFSANAEIRINDLDRRADGSDLSQTRNAKLQGEIKRLADQLLLEQRARKAAEVRLDRLYASTSWRFTAPLRALSRRLRG